MLRHCGQRRDCRQPHMRLPRLDPQRHTPPAALLLPRLAGTPSTVGHALSARRLTQLSSSSSPGLNSTRFPTLGSCLPFRPAFLDQSLARQRHRCRPSHSAINVGLALTASRTHP
uniref:Uncharacterized protein n=1 Tax=Panagrellus redivivus TaxID=6233 RepID=A0A7E4WDN7_PANRE